MSGSTRTTSSPHCSSASHPTGHILAESHEAPDEITNPCSRPSGNVSLGDHISAGLPLTGQRVTRRLGGPVAHILADGVLARTLACPVPPEARPRLPAPLVVTRRVCVRGAIMVGGQRIQVGLAHARKTVAVTVGPDTIQVAVEPGIAVTAARTTTSRDIRRHKASNYG